jgi:hypothetical protein
MIDRAMTAGLDLHPTVESPIEQQTAPAVPDIQPVKELSTRPRPSVIEEDVLLDSSQRKEAFDGIFKDNFWGNSESRSGYGSTLGYTCWCFFAIQAILVG